VQWCSVVVVVVQCGHWGIFLLTQKAILLVLVLVLGLFYFFLPADQEKYLKKKEMVGEGGITSGMDNFDTCTGLYKLTKEQALVKKERDAKEQDERNAKKERRAAQKAALKARGKAGLRSTSVKKQQQQEGEGKESKESKEGKESDEGKIGGEGKESKK